VSENGQNGAPPEPGGPYTGPAAYEPPPVHDHSDDPGYVTRTRFLTGLAIVGGGVLTAAILVPVVGFAVAQPLKPEEYRWVEIGPASTFLQNAPPYENPTTSTRFGFTDSLAVSGPDPIADRRVFVRFGFKTGIAPPQQGELSTAEFEARFTEFASNLTAEDFDLIAIWNRCAHLGCPVAYSAGGDNYLCPCHGGAYDSRGLVTAGPPPRPLDRLDIKIIDPSKTYTPEQIAAEEDRLTIEQALAGNLDELQILVGKPFSIDEEQQIFALRGPGEPVTGVLANLYPFQ
jgi:Rieske Fe-S protein